MAVYILLRGALTSHRLPQRWAVCGSEPGWSYKSTRPNLPRDTYPFLVKHIKVRGDSSATAELIHRPPPRAERPFSTASSTGHVHCASTADSPPTSLTQVTIYNGDWDSCVPYTDAEAWTEGMGYEVADPWHPWM